MQSSGIRASRQRQRHEDQGENCTTESDHLSPLQAFSQTKPGEHNEQNDPSDSDCLYHRDCNLRIGQNLDEQSDHRYCGPDKPPFRLYDGAECFSDTSVRERGYPIDRPLLYDVPRSEANGCEYCQAYSDCHSILGFADRVLVDQLSESQAAPDHHLHLSVLQSTRRADG